MLKRSEVVHLPIPGTGNPHQLEEYVAAAGITLTDADFKSSTSRTRLIIAKESRLTPRNDYRGGGLTAKRHVEKITPAPNAWRGGLIRA